MRKGLKALARDYNRRRLTNFSKEDREIILREGSLSSQAELIEFYRFQESLMKGLE